MAGNKLLPGYSFSPPKPAAGGKKQPLPEGLRKELDMLRSYSPAHERAAAASSFSDSAKKGSNIAEALPSLMDALQDEEVKIRIYASTAIFFSLTKFWSHPELVLPLSSALSDEDPDVRSYAVRSLGRLARKGNDHQEAMKAIINAMSDPDSGVRLYACRAVREACSREEVDILPAMDALHACMSDQNPRIRSEATTTIGKAAEDGIDISKMIPTLIASLTDSDASVRGVAADALKEAGKASAEAIKGFMPQIIAALKDKRLVRGAREKCIRLVGVADSKGVDISDAVPTLLEGISDPDASVRLASASALADAAKNHEHRKPIVLKMAELLASDSQEAQNLGLRVIEEMASKGIDVSDAPQAIGPIIAILAEDNSERLESAIKIVNSCFRSNFVGTRERLTKGIFEYITTASFAGEAERNSPKYVRTMKMFARVTDTMQQTEINMAKAGKEGA